MSDEPAIRLIDLNEQRLVVTIDGTGLMSVHVRRLCTAQAARILTEAAEQIAASHPAFPCHWDDERDTPAPADRPDEPLAADRGQLDAERQVWTDGTGHPWDLSVPWLDVTRVQWKWTGRLDRHGAPLMRSEFGDEIESLDVIRAASGPIVMAGGEQS